MEINRENYEVYALDYIEGDLSPSEVQAFEAFLSNNEDIKDLVTNFYVLNVAPNSEIVFEKKAELLRSNKILRPAYYWISRAAVILLLIAAGFFIVLHQWNSSNIANDLVEAPSANTINKAESKSHEISENSLTSKVDPVARNEVRQKAPESSKVFIPGRREEVATLPIEKEEAIGISDATSSKELIIDQTMVSKRRAVQLVKLLPMRSITFGPTEYEAEYKIDLTAPKYDLDAKSRLTIFSGLFANLDLVPERFDKVETSNVKSRFLPRSYFNK
ncbi:MAG: hypothetical protein HKN87_02090 [Saprospiraceae bacterium]|nr:hypothetical protein [Saprospiraceae bacterium]